MNRIAIDEHGWLSGWKVEDAGVSMIFTPNIPFKPEMVGQVDFLPTDTTCTGVVCGEVDQKDKPDVPSWLIEVMSYMCREVFTGATLIVESDRAAMIKFWGMRDSLYHDMHPEYLTRIVAAIMRPAAGSYYNQIRAEGGR